MKSAVSMPDPPRTGLTFRVAITLVMVLLTGATVWTISHLRSPSSPPVSKLSFQLIDASHGTPLESVSIAVLGSAQIQHSDENGFVTLTFPNVRAGATAKVLANKDGYSPYTQLVTVPGPSDPGFPIEILMSSVKQDPERYEKTFTSGPVSSGFGASFSAWYEVVASPPEPGYEIDSASSYFTLSGDRQCNAWSECAWGARSPNAISFRFRTAGTRGEFS